MRVVVRPKKENNMYSMQEPVNHIRSYVEPIAHKYHIRIDRDIEECSRYQEEIVQIRQASENDIIHVYINSNGGYVSTLGSILSALEQSPAKIVCELELDASSAATFIFLAADEWIVSDNANMMIHEFQYGAAGTSSNVKRQVDHSTKQCERMIRKYYKHFLSDEEIEDVLSGGEIYLDADGIMERLQKRSDAVQKEYEDAQEAAVQEQLEEMMGDPIPENILSEMDKPTLIRLIRGELSDEEEELLEEKLLVEDEGEEGTQVISETFTDEVYTLTIGSDGSIDDHSGEGIFLSFSTLLYDDQSLGIKELKGYAGILGVKYAHNISETTLAERLDEKVAEIVDSLNQ